MKKRFVYIGSVIILIISVFTFVVFGFGTEVFTALLGNRNKLPAFGEYDGQKVELTAGSEFQTLAAQRAEYYKYYGQNIDSNTEFEIYQAAFQETIRNMAYTKSVKKSGYIVSDEAINRSVLSYYQDQTGAYSSILFNKTESSVRESRRKQSEKSLILSRFEEDMLGSNATVGEEKLYGLKTSSKAKAFLADMGTEKRSFNMAAFNTNNFPKTEAAEFAKTKAELFIKYDLSAITVDSENEAKTLLKQLENKEVTFQDAVKNKSKSYYTDATGKLAIPYHYQIQSMLQDANDLPEISGLAKDALSKVIQTTYGYTIFRGDGESVAADFSDDAMLDIVIKYMKEKEQGYIENYYTGIAKDFTSEAAINGFDKACEKYEITMVDVPAFPLNYGDSSFFGTLPASSVKELKDGSTNTNLLKTVFSLKLDELSTPIVLGSNVLVFKCTGIQKDPPASTDSFASTIDSVNSSSCFSTLMASDKVVNNFMQVYLKSFNQVSSLN